MERDRRRVVAALVGLALPATRSAAAPAQATAAGSDQERIRALVEVFARAWNAGDVEALAGVYTEPHLDLNDPRPLCSRTATARRLERFHAARESHLEIRSDEVVVLGNWALQRGEFVLTHRARTGGAVSVERRRYLEVLRRVGDGSWRVHWAIDAPLLERR